MDSRITDKYSIKKELGKGAFGTVYLAKHRQLGEFKAIKELKPETSKEKLRVKREVKMLREAQHPHVIGIDEVIDTGQVTYICMEYAERGSLEQKLQQEIKKNRSLGITIGILRGVQTLHARGIIHRDLKPANILFNAKGKAKIGDFGIAKSDLNISKELTQTGVVLGTIGYMAPEQLLGEKYEVDEQSDIYAVGVMMYEMLAGEHPFKGENQLETMNRVLQENYKVRLENYEIEKELREICYKAVSKEKSKRYSNASDMLEDLITYSVQNSKGITSNKNTSIIEKLKGGLVGLIGGVFITSLGGECYGVTNNFDKEWSKKQQEYKELSINYEDREGIYFTRIQKSVQREIYDGLQKENDKNITERVLEGENLYKLGMIYYKGRGVEKDYQTAYTYFERAEEHGSLEAKLKLAEMWEYGIGREMNKEKAMEYYEWLADKGDPRGYSHLGIIYYDKGMKDKGIQYLERSAEVDHVVSIERLIPIYQKQENKKKLLYYLNKGAELNHPMCLKNLGVLFIFGQYGVQKNEAKGMEYMKKAIQYGSSDAIQFVLNYKEGDKKSSEKLLADVAKVLEKRQGDKKDGALNTLGYIYLHGVGVEKDYNKAKKLFEEAAAFDNMHAVNNLAFIYHYGYGVKKNSQKAESLYEQAIEMGDNNAMTNLANMYRDGTDLKQDYRKAKRLYENAIQHGNNEAITNLGYMYKNGYGMERDYRKAREYYEAAVKLGNIDAMLYLGEMYENGYGVKKDYAKAKKLYEESNKGGNTNAVNKLGLMYRHGRGVNKDYMKAKELFEKAICMGSSASMVNLGLMYEIGLGVKQDYVKSAELYKKAINRDNNMFALTNLGIFYEKGYGVEKDYSKAKKLYEQAMNLGSSHAMKSLASMYFDGNGVKQDYSKAKRLYEQAIFLGNVKAINDLAMMYIYGYGVEKDLEKGRKLFEDGAALGHSQAMFNLGAIYAEGLGVKKDYKKSKIFYEKAVQLGSTGAMVNLGVMYYKGHGVEKSYKKAKEWYEKAVKLGDSDAMINLGLMYRSGNGVTKDTDKAKELILKSLSLGNKNALKYLNIKIIRKNE